MEAVAHTSIEQEHMPYYQLRRATAGAHALLPTATSNRRSKTYGNKPKFTKI
ncbi:hypothetical protein ACYSNR_06085 [Enterococcus sp. LJL128]